MIDKKSFNFLLQHPVFDYTRKSLEMAKKNSKFKGDRVPDGVISKDTRFAGIQSDPRFHIPKRKHLKDKLDERFSKAIETDEAFQDEMTIDRYGRKVLKSSKKEFKKYYNVESEGSQSEEVRIEEETEKESESEEETKTAGMPDRARGEGLSESDSDSDSEGEESEEEEVGEEEEAEPNARQVAETPLGDATSRFAVVSMDWDRIRAVDLMVAFSSFVPSQGRIKCIQIFPSEYGKTRMAQEELEGPAREHFKTKKRQDDSDSEDDSEEEEKIKKSLVQEDLGEEVDSSKFRKYQLQRLQYYYAVITCDSVKTAKAIYDSCDGIEYESTANFFDLRYIPEEMTFDEIPRDECTQIPSNFKPSSFVTDALQHSKVKLTWDETPMERIQLATRTFSEKEIDDMDFKAYLASDSDSDDAVTSISKYKELLGDVIPKGQSKEEKDIDMEITFAPGLDEKEQEAESSESEKEENTIEKYRRREKERRQRRMDKLKASKENDEDENDDRGHKGADSKRNKKKNKKGDRIGSRSKEDAELELLLMDDDLSKQMPTSISNKTNDGNGDSSKKKGKKNSKKIQKLEDSEAQFDMNDLRFQELFENPDFAIDPTAPQFKKTTAMNKVMEERRRRTTFQDQPGEKTAKKRKVEAISDSLDSLVAKIKRRVKK